ncbi:MAG: adenine-specific methyltransferase EcoRI family protein [Bacteroidetes bacterium]|nr:adenine-specific methyltransferase EcoRI family protein [Bacteroidota bacterium]
MKNTNLYKAKKSKNDEFYTQYHDIEKEMTAYVEYNPDVFRDKTILLPCNDLEWSNFTKYFAQNFEMLGLRKLISTSYAMKKSDERKDYQPSNLEINSPKYDRNKSLKNGKIYILDRDKNHDNKIDMNDLEWKYLDGDGDFRSEEVKALRDEADIIITNPPFSLFREFLAWIMESGKLFVMISNLNAITYKEVFSLIKNDNIWLGNGFHAGNAFFSTPFAKEYADGVYNSETGLVKFRNVCWFTNIDHGRRHQPLPLMTLSDNLKYSKHKDIKGKESYDSYDNYDAIEVPFTDAIPRDYAGVMGVPISFLDKYCPEQFELLGIMNTGEKNKGIRHEGTPHGRPIINGIEKYLRILIRQKGI